MLVKGTAGETKNDDETIELDLGASREGSRTDAEVLQREGEAIQLDGLNPSQVKELRDKVMIYCKLLCYLLTQKVHVIMSFLSLKSFGRPKSMSSRLKSTE